MPYNTHSQEQVSFWVASQESLLFLLLLLMFAIACLLAIEFGAIFGAILGPLAALRDARLEDALSHPVVLHDH